MKWDKNKKLIKNKIRYTLNPWTLIWANDRYYLYGYDTDERDGKHKERNYRVDKLANIEITEVDRYGKELFSHFNADTYVSKCVGMFSGEEKMITVRVPERLVGAFIDQFGKRIKIIEDEQQEASNDDKNENKLIIRFCAVKSKVLLGWLIGLGDVEVLEPMDVREMMTELIDKNRRYYS